MNILKEAEYEEGKRDLKLKSRFDYERNIWTNLSGIRSSYSAWLLKAALT
jgi:hypothetical protein